MTAKVARLLFPRPVPRAEAKRLAALEAERREVNRSTRAALAEAVDGPGPTSRDVYDALDRLYTRQLEQQHRIDEQLKSATTGREPALRAGAVAVLYMLALKLRKAELKTFDVALNPTEDEADEPIRFAEGDLRLARQCYVEVRQKYLQPLEDADLRLDRLARRVVLVLKRRWQDALAKDPGVNDIRQELAGLNDLIADNDALLRGVAADHFSGRLSRLGLRAGKLSDVELVEYLTAIVAGVDDPGYEPVDENYPLLFLRSRSIRATFYELPAWSWSMRWRAHCAILHGWLLLFAAAAAQRDGKRRLTRTLRRQAQAAQSEASRLIAEIALLERGLKPLVTKVGLCGQRAKVAGFREPLTRKQLLRLSDSLSVRVNRDLSR